ncbi:MAG: hypothetical protein JXB42_12765 [Deltaproteobacteria bacterium]|nr:hypothetical protein [Deltaproteobacteria bacterium]
MFRIDRNVIIQSAVKKTKQEILGNLIIGSMTLKKRAWQYGQNPTDETLDKLCERVAAMYVTLNEAIVVTSVHKTFGCFREKMASLKKLLEEEDEKRERQGS